MAEANSSHKEQQLENAACEARELSTLLRWISTARHQVEAFDVARKVFPQIDMQLRELGPELHATWGYDEECAMQRLFLRLDVALEKLAEHAAEPPRRLAAVA